MTRTLLPASLLITLAACTGGGADDYAAVLPDERLLIDLPTGGARSALGDEAEYYALTADVTAGVNGLISDVLEGLDYVTSFEPTWSDDDHKALWGPWEDGPTNARLWVEQTEDGGYNWAIDAKLVEEGDDAYTPLMAGQIDPEATEIASVGRMVIDFDAVSRVSPDEDATGEFYVEYDLDGEAVTAQAGFAGFTGDDGVLLDAMYAYDQDGSGAGSMDLAVSADQWGTPLPELHIVRTRWTPAGEGRADVYVTQGDLGDLVYTATECWDGSHDVTFYEENYELTREGDETACVFAEPEFSEAETAPVQ